MAGKINLSRRGEYTDPIATVLILKRRDECCFRIIRLQSDLLHAFVAKGRLADDNRQRVAAIRRLCKHIDNIKRVCHNSLPRDPDSFKFSIRLAPPGTKRQGNIRVFATACDNTTEVFEAPEHTLHVDPASISCVVERMVLLPVGLVFNDQMPFFAINRL